MDIPVYDQSQVNRPSATPIIPAHGYISDTPSPPPVRPETTTKPVASISLNGTIIDEVVVSLDVDNNNFFSPDTFRVELALGGLPRKFGPAFWASSQAEIGLFVGLGTGTRTQLILGQADSIELDLPRGIICASGRDLSAPLLDTRTVEKFQNQTSSQIVAAIAARHGLTPNAAATSTQVGKYYQIDHARLTDSASEWTLLSYLAQEEGFDLWVSGSTLNFQPSQQGSAPAYTLHYTPPTANSLQQGDFIDLQLRRSQTLARDIIVKVRSWNSKTAAAFTAIAKRSNGAGSVNNGTAQLYTLTVPGLDQAQAQQLANAKLEEYSRHERNVDVTMPGDLTLQPRQMVALAGTGTSFDQSYFIDRIHRRLGEEGYIQTVGMKNHSPESTVSV